MFKIYDITFENIDDLLSYDLAPLCIAQVQNRLWEEANERGLDYPSEECLSFIADMNPCWQIEFLD